MAKCTRGTVSSTPAQSRSGIGQFAREQPLLTGVLCVAFGVVLGCLLRMTPEESEFLGEQADKFKDQASKLKDSVGDLATEGYGKAKQFAERAVDVAAQTLTGATDKSSAHEPESEVGSPPSSETPRNY